MGNPISILALFNTHVGTVKQTVMVYCYAVESTIVGAPKHSLLRKVELERKGEGRAAIKPLHCEWIQSEINILKTLKCLWLPHMVICWCYHPVKH